MADEVPFDIPDSWEWVRIRSLGEIVCGSGIKRNETVQQGLPCVRYGELYTTYQTSFTSAVSFIAPNLYEKCKHFSYGDVLMTLTGENKPDIAKAVAYLGTEPIAAGGDLAFWTQHGINPLFLSYIMASPYIIGRKVALATGDIIVHISGDKLGTILLPVPPLAEQERIVARIQESELAIENYALKATSLQKLQDSFPEALKKSILQEAVQGKLYRKTRPTSLQRLCWSVSGQRNSGSSRRAKSRRTSTNPSFSDGIILIMRSWTVWSAVSTMNCPLKYPKTGAGARLAQSLLFKLVKTFKPQKSTRIHLPTPIRATGEMAFGGM